MSRDSSPEEGEILEDGEIAPEDAASAQVLEQEAGEIVSEPQRRAEPDSSNDYWSLDGLRQSDQAKHGAGSSRHARHAKGTAKGESGAHERSAASLEHSLKSNYGGSSATERRIAELNELSRGLSIQQANRSLEIFCRSLRQALKLLAQLDSPQVALAGKVFSGLRALQIVSSTGAGKQAVRTCQPASEAAEFANHNLRMFSVSQQKEFRGWCLSSKVFAGLLKREQPPSSASEELQKRVSSSGAVPSGRNGPEPAAAKPAGLPAPTLQPLPRPSFLMSGSARGAPPTATQPEQHRSRQQLDGGSADKPGARALGTAAGYADGVPGLGLHSGSSHRHKRARHAAVQTDSDGVDEDTDLYRGEPEGLTPPPALTGGTGPEFRLPATGRGFGHLPPGIDLDGSEVLDGIASTNGTPLLSGASSPGPAGAGPPASPQLDEDEARIFGTVHAPGSLSAAVTQHLREGRLCAVLDLDHTLLNSARWGEVSAGDASRLEAALERQEALAFKQRSLHSLEAIQMWTKLRPACRQLLAALSDKYVIWIHTNGNRQYADAVCNLLDPDGRLFGGRVVANSGVGGAATAATATDLIKRLDSQGLAGLDPITVIVDDTATVWPGHAANLLQVERYCYFPSSTRQFGYNRVSLLEANRDESPEQGMLSVVQRVLLRAHQEALDGFAAQEEADKATAWDIRSILARLRSQILLGVKILFSRLWRTDLRSEDAPLWRLARTLGAECATALDDSVTHVVTNTRYTEKVAKALQLGKHVVSARWLEGSAIMWARADERSFQVPP